MSCERPGEPHHSWLLRSDAPCHHFAASWTLCHWVRPSTMAALIEAVERREVQDLDQICQPPRAHLPPYTPVRRHAQLETPASQHPSPRTRCTMVAIHVKKAATLAGERGQWEWEKQASTQPHAKWLWVESGRSTGRSSSMRGQDP